MAFSSALELKAFIGTSTKEIEGTGKDIIIQVASVASVNPGPTSRLWSSLELLGASWLASVAHRSADKPKTDDRLEQQQEPEDPVTEALMAPLHLCSVKCLSYLGKHPWQQSTVLWVVTVPCRRGFDHGQNQGLRQKIFYGQMPTARAKGVLPGSHAPCAWVYVATFPCCLPAIPSGSTEVMYVLRKIVIFAMQFSICNIFIALKS